MKSQNINVFSLQQKLSSNHPLKDFDKVYYIDAILSSVENKDSCLLFQVKDKPRNIRIYDHSQFDAQRHRILSYLHFKIKDDSSASALDVFFLGNENDRNLFRSWKILPSILNDEFSKEVGSEQIKKLASKLSAIEKKQERILLGIRVEVSSTGKAYARALNFIFN